MVYILFTIVVPFSYNYSLTLSLDTTGELPCRPQGKHLVQKWGGGFGVPKLGVEKRVPEMGSGNTRPGIPPETPARKRVREFPEKPVS